MEERRKQLPLRLVPQRNEGKLPSFFHVSLIGIGANILCSQRCKGALIFLIVILFY